MEKSAKFEPGYFYHEIMHANGNDVLFKDRKDHQAFQYRLRRFILPCSEIVSYAQLGNHVHLLLKPHPPEVLTRITTRLKWLEYVLHPTELEDYLDGNIALQDSAWHPGTPVDYHQRIVSSIRSLKASYKYFYGQKYNHKGVLWGRDKLTKLLPGSDDILRTILYIHKNPVYHGMAPALEEWEFSSYWEVLTQTPCVVRPETILDMVGPPHTFNLLHEIQSGDFGRKSKSG